ncbi:transposase [Bradyrhizobium ottawaense]|uniref:transposase n=1 Tax=Bradyrhizobium ottawaense TaxID=931866 RepID=UPI0038378CF3
MVHRGADRWRELSDLCREGCPADLAARRYRRHEHIGSHKSKIARRLIRSAGAKLFFLPKYSPDLNPIERVFAKLKRLVGKAVARIRRHSAQPSEQFRQHSLQKNAPAISKTPVIKPTAITL